MNDGSITGNNSTSSTTGSHDGGGVYTSGHFTMNGGTISNNSTFSDGGGGGVFITGTFIMNDGFILGNTGTRGGGVLVSYWGGTFDKNGGTIYGYTEGDPNSNKATGTYNGVLWGHAASDWNSVYRNTTHGPEDGRLYIQGMFKEGWDN
jgi:hypothetical protein